MGPGAKIDGYQLEGEIARGAFGTVFRAKDGAGRDVALKLLSGRLDERSRERFLREGQITAALEDTGIVRVFGCGELDGKPYLVYELVPEGRTLRDLFQQSEESELVRVVRDAAQALGHAHGRGVIHRDVKPDNLLVDGEGQVRVADFGLAIAEGDERLTRTGELVGTPHYMAPEQIDTKRQGETPATDVWALGVVLYEALTGVVPFDGASLVELGANVLKSKPSVPSTLRPGISPALDTVCMRALQREPSARYADGAALAAAIDEALVGEAPGPGLDPRTALTIAAVCAFLVAVAVWLPSQGDPPRAAGTPAPSPSGTSHDPAGGAPDPLTRARNALAADRPQDALAALAAAPAEADVQLVLAEAQLSLGQAVAARATLTGLRSREAERLLAFADLLAGDLNSASRRLKHPQDLRALELERQRLALDESLVEAGSLGIGFDGSRCLAQARELASRTREALVPLGPLGRELRARLMTTLTEAALTSAVVMDRNDLLPELDAMLGALSPLRPDLSLGIDAARSWLWYFTGKRSQHPRVRELARRDPTPQIDAIDPRLRGVALGMHFLTAPPERRRELRPLAERALQSRIPAGPVGIFRSELLATLSIDQHQLSWAAFKAGDHAGGRELLAPAMDWGEELAQTRTSATRWWAAQALYTFLLAGDLDRARSYLNSMDRDESLTRYARVELELVAGNTREAYRLLTAFEISYVEALVAKAHCLLLLGGEEDSSKEIDRLIRQARASPWRRTWVGWHAPEEFEHLRAGGWWPGKR